MPRKKYIEQKGKWFDDANFLMKLFCAKNKK